MFLNSNAGRPIVWLVQESVCPTQTEDKRDRQKSWMDSVDQSIALKSDMQSYGPQKMIPYIFVKPSHPIQSFPMLCTLYTVVGIYFSLII